MDPSGPEFANIVTPSILKEWPFNILFRADSFSFSLSSFLEVSILNSFHVSRSQKAGLLFLLLFCDRFCRFSIACIALAADEPQWISYSRNDFSYCSAPLCSFWKFLLTSVVLSCSHLFCRLPLLPSLTYLCVCGSWLFSGPPWFSSRYYYFTPSHDYLPFT